ncbi:MAG: NADH-quinone oxidoreductase subunit C [Candidatus Hydrothermales bacterium]
MKKEILKKEFNLEETKDGILIFPVKEFYHFMEKVKGLFPYLSFITACHFPERKEFEIIYCVRDPQSGETLIFKTFLKEDEEIPSAYKFYKGADWMEREIYDLFGVKFKNHPDLRRILLPEDWEGHPLRKDYEINRAPEKYDYRKKQY